MDLINNNNTEPRTRAGLRSYTLAYTLIKMHYVIIIPGLSSDTKKLEFATKHWQDKGLTPRVFPINWKDGSTEFTPKLQKT